MQAAHHAPGCLVGQTHGAYLAGIDQFLEGRQCLFQIGGLLVLVVGIAQATEEVGRTVRPVQLVEIDVVGVQACKACVDGLMKMGASQARSAADVLDTGAGSLGGDDHVVAALAALEPGAYIALGQSLGFGLGWHRVHLGGVDEVDAEGHRAVELGMGLGLGVLLAEGHGSKAQATDVDAGVAKGTDLHGDSLW